MRDDGGGQFFGPNLVGGGGGVETVFAEIVLQGLDQRGNVQRMRTLENEPGSDCVKCCGTHAEGKTQGLWRQRKPCVMSSL